MLHPNPLEIPVEHHPILYKLGFLDPTLLKFSMTVGATWTVETIY